MKRFLAMLLSVLLACSVCRVGLGEDASSGDSAGESSGMPGMGGDPVEPGTAAAPMPTLWEAMTKITTRPCSSPPRVWTQKRPLPTALPAAHMTALPRMA